MATNDSIYRIGANDGLFMGIYLTVIFLIQSLGLGVTMLQLIGTLMMLAVPVVAYIILKRGYLYRHAYETFSAVWLHGIIMFLCGGLILALVVYIFTRYVQPTFIAEQIKLMADTYKELGTEEAVSVGNVLDKVIDQHMVPTPISIAFTLLWLVGFSGAMLSCLLALIIRGIYRGKKRKN